VSVSYEECKHCSQLESQEMKSEFCARPVVTGIPQ
jgi:hypothetical protein